MQPILLVAAGLVPAMVFARALAPRSVDCIYFTPVSSGVTCQSLANDWQLTVDGLTKLNPGITCPNLDASKEYCVMGTFTDDATTTTSATSIKSPSTSLTTSTSFTVTSLVTTTLSSTKFLTTTTSSSTTSSSSTPSTPGNGVTTPVPTQTGMVGNCNKFHFVDKDQTCDTIAALYSISTAQFVQWNPAVKGDCTGLWASTYACVGLLGGTPTTGPNGIVTPTPTQPGIVSNCNKFVKVNQGDTCDAIAFWNGLPGGQQVKDWNNLGQDCVGLQVGSYACIGVIPSSTPTQPTATTGPNGISTPLPTQSGLISSCNKFVKVNAGDTCDSIASRNGPISTATFVFWNAGVGGTSCKALQAGTYACVGVTAGTPTLPGNGIATPTPTQPHMVSNCNKFVMVNPGDTCDAIAFWNGVSGGSQWVKLWNGLADDCRDIWANAYACIGVLS